MLHSDCVNPIFIRHFELLKSPLHDAYSALHSNNTYLNFVPASCKDVDSLSRDALFQFEKQREKYFFFFTAFLDKRRNCSHAFYAVHFNTFLSTRTIRT